jgi:hypothetical protein
MLRRVSYRTPVVHGEERADSYFKSEWKGKESEEGVGCSRKASVFSVFQMEVKLLSGEGRTHFSSQVCVYDALCAL